MLVFPNCKINLGLSIVEKRNDGFHNIETVFYPIPLFDVLEVIPSEDGETEFFSSGLPIPGDANKNLCFKAYQLLKKDFDLPPVKIHLHKVIPMGAGLGGGSSDAAQTLVLLNDLFELRISESELLNYASKLGADCAFFILNKAIYAEEKGDKFKNIDLDLKWKTIVLVGLSVFTMGLATVGFAGFSGAMAAAGGGFGGFMSAVGSTMYAGATAALGSIGIGSGAQGAAAIAGGVEGVGLMGGHLAATLGSESAKAGIAAQTAGMVPGTASFVGPSATLAGSSPTAAPTLTAGATEATKQAAAQSVKDAAVKEVAKKGMGDFTKAALVTTGGGMLSGLAQAKMMEEEKPKALWGVPLRGKEARDYADDGGLTEAPPSPLEQFIAQAQGEQNPFNQPMGLMDMYAPQRVPGGY